MTVFNIDADDEHADWLRSMAWDLPEDKDAFLAVIGGRERLEHFLTLPAARAMPDALRASLDAEARSIAPRDLHDYFTLKRDTNTP